ncbi:hypothetical protein K504DRAFT_539426 [Pleomassaria siparia CBS 279.74]|uniref:Uncharacterized protein n=1 Tax=Pleomassaria siparia CBS 279.74 TaxID=1314801 RepID=A0A6G1JQF1_9PLEO|nr:hypothetical protein K504DRAFT_539426 [Pleomassaria siparia CBS 279.74]
MAWEFALSFTTPGLVHWLEKNKRHDSLRVDDIKDWMDDPPKPPLYDAFYDIIEGDAKWAELILDIDRMEESLKTAEQSQGARNKCMMGVRLPVIGHPYAIGLARRFGHDYGKPKNVQEIEKRTATTIHARMNQHTRTEHIDVFNVLKAAPVTHGLRYDVRRHQYHVGFLRNVGNDGVG